MNPYPSGPYQSYPSGPYFQPPMYYGYNYPYGAGRQQLSYSPRYGDPQYGGYPPDGQLYGAPAFTEGPGAYSMHQQPVPVPSANPTAPAARKNESGKGAQTGSSNSPAPAASVSQQPPPHLTDPHGGGVQQQHYVHYPGPYPPAQRTDQWGIYPTNQWGGMPFMAPSSPVAQPSFPAGGAAQPAGQGGAGGAGRDALQQNRPANPTYPGAGSTFGAQNQRNPW